jgi:hypothetical protein
MPDGWQKRFAKNKEEKKCVRRSARRLSIYNASKGFLTVQNKSELQLQLKNKMTAGTSNKGIKSKILPKKVCLVPQK